MRRHLIRNGKTFCNSGSPYDFEATENLAEVSCGNCIRLVEMESHRSFVDKKSFARRKRYKKIDLDIANELVKALRKTSLPEKVARSVALAAASDKSEDRFHLKLGGLLISLKVEKVSNFSVDKILDQI